MLPVRMLSIILFHATKTSTGQCSLVTSNLAEHFCSAPVLKVELIMFYWDILQECTLPVKSLDTLSH